MKPTLKNLLVGVAAGLASCEYRAGGTVPGRICLSSEVFDHERLSRFLLQALVHSTITLPDGETRLDHWVLECVESFIDQLGPGLRDIETVEHSDIVFRDRSGEALRFADSPWSDGCVREANVVLDSIARENFVFPADSWGIGYDPVFLGNLTGASWAGQVLGRQVLDWRKDSIMRICKGLVSSPPDTSNLLVYLHKDPFSQAVA
jgi:hypothetical protein